MAQKPHKFTNEKQLVCELGSDKNREQAQEFFSQRFEDIKTVVKEGVAGNTFRAFRIWKGNKPSVVFREWTEAHIHETLGELCNISKKGDYADYVHNATLELCKIWPKKMNAEMGYGRGSKLLNLVFKKLACYSRIDAFKKTLIDLQHVPLDSYTIVGLKYLLPKLSIPASATMKFVTNRDEYYIFQEYISSVAQKAGVPPIYYDILAWDKAHPKGNKATVRTANRCRTS
jgi:hypothetical protein